MESDEKDSISSDTEETNEPVENMSAVSTGEVAPITEEVTKTSSEQQELPVENGTEPHIVTDNPSVVHTTPTTLTLTVPKKRTRTRDDLALSPDQTKDGKRQRKVNPLYTGFAMDKKTSAVLGQSPEGEEDKEKEPVVTTPTPTTPLSGKDSNNKKTPLPLDLVMSPAEAKKTKLPKGYALEPVIESSKNSSPLPAKRDRRKTSIVADYEQSEEAEASAPSKQKKEKEREREKEKEKDKDKEKEKEKKKSKKQKAEVEQPPPQSMSVTLKPKQEELATQVETLEQKKALLQSQLEQLQKDLTVLSQKKESAISQVNEQSPEPQTIVSPTQTFEQTPELTQSITLVPKPKKEIVLPPLDPIEPQPIYSTPSLESMKKKPRKVFTPILPKKEVCV